MTVGQIAAITAALAAVIVLVLAIVLFSKVVRTMDEARRAIAAGTHQLAQMVAEVQAAAEVQARGAPTETSRAPTSRTENGRSENGTVAEAWTSTGTQNLAAVNVNEPLRTATAQDHGGGNVGLGTHPIAKTAAFAFGLRTAVAARRMRREINTPLAAARNLKKAGRLR